MRFQFKIKEIIELSLSSIILTMGFWVFWNGSVGIAEIILGIITGFIFHELAHKFTAQLMRYSAYYRMWKTGSILAIITPFLGFLFAAPGAVKIGPKIDLWGRKTVKKKDIGIIGLAGPLTNIILATILMLIGFFYVTFENAIMINIFLALFNMIPIRPLDGHKVKEWSWLVWGLMIILIVTVSIISNFSIS